MAAPSPARAETAGAIRLPGLIQRHIDRRAQGFLAPSQGPAIAFDSPPGEAALIGPDSISWRVFKSPLALFIGGVSAVLLELAEPRVREGVWRHTSFREKPLERIQRTAYAAMVTVYAPRAQAETLIARVTRLHGLVRGQTPEGEPYDALDPELLDWVQATASYGFVTAYGAFVQPLSKTQLDAFYAEGQAAAALYGATQAPTTQAEAEALFARMGPRLRPSPIVHEFLDIMLRVPALPRIASPLQRMLVQAAVGLLPDWVREHLQLDARWHLGAAGRWSVTRAARFADRVLLVDSPAVQACRRLGLADDHLYRRRPPP